MKMHSTAALAPVLASFLLTLAACGTATTVDAVSPSPDLSESEIAMDEDSTPSTASSPNGSGDWLSTDTELTNFQPSSEGTVEVDPSNPAQIIVTFPAGFAPCAGGRAMATETEDAVVVTLETGLHGNVAAMTCPAGTDDHQLVLSLQAEVGGRTLSIS